MCDTSFFFCVKITNGDFVNRGKTMARKSFSHLTWTKRLQLEALLKAKTPVKDIAKALGVHISTIYREVKRGRYEHIDGATWISEDRYSPDIANEKYRDHLTAKGAPVKIGNDHEFAAYIEKRIIEDKLSPAAVLGEIKHGDFNFKTSICTNTLYSYIEKGVFYRLSFSHLSNKKKKRAKRAVKIAKPPRGTSIERRPEEINARNTFGHWEMDCVVGKQKTKNVLLTFTERLTRYEIILRLPNRKTETVVKALNRLEWRFGSDFRKVFKSITVDNGSEFSDYQGLERSIYGGKRTSVFYCHPYCSSERGSNERLNREIRRLIPKGADLSKYSSDEIQQVENWVNSYPRGILGYASSGELFRNELLKVS